MVSPVPPSLAAQVLRRARPLAFGPPSPRLRHAVAVPAKDEAASLPRLVAALEAQRVGGRSPFDEGKAEALVLLNNCSDGSPRVMEALARTRPWLRWAHVALAPPEAHVGRARQLAMDAACARVLASGAAWAGGARGLVLTTDADTEPEPDWMAQTVAEVAHGAHVVGGRALLRAEERAALPPGVRRLYLLDLAYRRALEQLRELYDPCEHDPTPRHHHHFGASLAVLASAYARVGGMPAAPTSEDVALVDALVDAGARLRHSPAVRVRTSARAVGRAEGGLADAFAWWDAESAAGREPHVEAAADAERRLACLGLARAAEPHRPPPRALRTTPEALPGLGEPITDALAGLRARIARLRLLDLADRLRRARRLTSRPTPSLFPPVRFPAAA